MKYWVKARVEEGLIDSEKTAYVRTEEGYEEEVFVHYTHVREGAMKVGVVIMEDSRVLVEFSREASSGKHRAWVPREALCSDEERVMRIYAASSWRNARQPLVVESLRAAGHEVYDFRNPSGGEDHGFHWSEIDPDWQRWSAKAYLKGLQHPLAEHGFRKDWEAMQWADACVLVMPCGRSAHLEAGYFVGACKPLHILIEESSEPELMYKMATGVHVSLEHVINALKEKANE